ncbi:hypothetical protein H0H81_007237 [Sphagnurus paluster]|uniref:Uncharacterized protein n=1 Tax=Sphagnurus paluster TaxID=117069 RepID=A0A9P7K586_9AGAR|nr:hypothetical protein H0H81_007237 [Sphagnurus paluster]
MAILQYAAKYNHTDLVDEAAPLTIEYEFLEVKNQFEKGSRIPYIWLEYREQWASIIKWIYTVNPPISTQHKGGLSECNLWKPFYWKVLEDLKMCPSRVKRARQFIEMDITRKLEDCSHCIRRAQKWIIAAEAKIEAIQPLSNFL